MCSQKGARAPRAALAIGSFVGILLHRIDSQAGTVGKRPRSLEIYGPLVNETVAAAAKALKQQREHSPHSIFPHTAHQTLGAAHIFSFSPHTHTQTHTKERAVNLSLFFPAANPFISIIARAA